MIIKRRKRRFTRRIKRVNAIYCSNIFDLSLKHQRLFIDSLAITNILFCAINEFENEFISILIGGDFNTSNPFPYYFVYAIWKEKKTFIDQMCQKIVSNVLEFKNTHLTLSNLPIIFVPENNSGDIPYHVIQNIGNVRNTFLFKSSNTLGLNITHANLKFGFDVFKVLWNSNSIRIYTESIQSIILTELKNMRFKMNLYKDPYPIYYSKRGTKNPILLCLILGIIGMHQFSRNPKIQFDTIFSKSQNFKKK